MKVIPVILSGGSGTRLWPLSRKDHPKQYLSLMGKSTMLQETILRLEGLDNLANPIIICNNDHRFIVSEQCKQINIENPTIILEPVGRNTAPAIAAAAFQSLMQSDNSILIILSTDHVIQDVEKFQKSIRLAIKQAKDGKLVTFGVVPKYAHTGFGYIKLSEKLYKSKKFEGSWNFGPRIKNNLKVIDVVKFGKNFMKSKSKIIIKKNKYYESTNLSLNSNKSLKQLNWKTLMNAKQALRLSFEWYKFYDKNFSNVAIVNFTLEQINNYKKIVKSSI